MLAHKLQVFKPYEDGNNTDQYRLAVIDLTQPEYPANFVCLLPKRLIQKPRAPNNFEKKFGARNIDYAMKLLKNAMKSEKDTQTKNELQSRLNILACEKKQSIKLNC
jgi:hypothetical protein